MWGIPKTSGHLGSGVVEQPKDVLWTPDVLGDDVIAWWDVLDATQIGMEGLTIRTIIDRSPHGQHDLQQVNHADQPMWVEHAITNSFEAAVYDGANDIMESDFTLTGSFCIVQMLRTGEALQSQASSFNGGINDAILFLRNEDFGDAVTLNAGTSVSSGKVLELQTNYIVVAQFDNANANVSLNGEVFSTPGIGTLGITEGPHI